MRRPLLIALVAALCACGTAAAATGRLADDPLQSQEWWLHDIGADQATPPGPGVPLTIVYSGLDINHPDFVGRPNTTLLNAQTVDGPQEWHGTTVTSLAAAPANGVGIVGVYPQAALQIWDASPTAGGVSTLAAVAGIETAAQHCPGVINLSFGSTQPNPQLQQAVLDAYHNGCLVVASAGNDGASGHPELPAAYPHVLTVGATDQSDKVADFSSQGPWLDLVAPGVELTGAVPLSHDPSGYSPIDGTSFSAPLVAAAAAWIWTVRPTLDVTQIFELMRRSARDLGPPGFDSASGWGLLNIPNALAAPVPARDPEEPNDDVDEVKPGGLFAAGQPTLTTAARPSNRIAGTLDATEDPSDLYRIWVPAQRVVRVAVSSDGNAAARIWGPLTASVNENLAARRRDLKGTLVRGGSKGFSAYVEVLPTGRSGEAQYVLSVKSSTR